MGGEKRNVVFELFSERIKMRRVCRDLYFLLRAARDTAIHASLVQHRRFK